MSEAGTIILIIPFILIGFLIVHPGFQVVSSSGNEHGYNTPVMLYDNDHYYIVRHDSASHWKFSIPFITPEIPWVRIEDPYIYNMQVRSSDGVLMNAKISYKMTTDEYFDNNLWGKNARMYGLHWQEIMGHQACDKVAIQYASKHTAEDLFRNGYYDRPILINFRYIDKAQEVALKAKIDTDFADPYMKAYVRDGSYNYNDQYNENYDEYAKIYGVAPKTSKVSDNVATTDDAMTRWAELKSIHPDMTEADVTIDEYGFYSYTYQGTEKGYRLSDNVDYSKYGDNGGVSTQEEANAIFDKVILESS